jgi:hypothetical protein
MRIVISGRAYFKPSSSHACRPATGPESRKVCTTSLVAPPTHSVLRQVAINKTNGSQNRRGRGRAVGNSCPGGSDTTSAITTNGCCRASSPAVLIS